MYVHFTWRHAGNAVPGDSCVYSMVACRGLMKKQILGLQESLSHPYYNRPQQHTERRSDNPVQSRGCLQWYQSSNGDNCNHCYKCGSGEHYAQGCRSRQQNFRSGKWRGVAAMARALTRDENYPRSHVCSVSPSKQREVTCLVGKKRIVNCTIQVMKTRALWDTGAKISLIPAHWSKRHLHVPGIQLHPLSELLESDDLNLTVANGSLTVANGSPIQFDGWLLQVDDRALWWN